MGAIPTLLPRGIPHRLAKLFDGSGLDLAHALLADVIAPAQILKRGRIVTQPALAQDAALALAQTAQRIDQEAASLGQLVAVGQPGLLTVGRIDQPGLPFA